MCAYVIHSLILMSSSSSGSTMLASLGSFLIMVDAILGKVSIRHGAFFKGGHLIHGGAY